MQVCACYFYLSLDKVYHMMIRSVDLIQRFVYESSQQLNL
jgi:hypothetical protein